METELKTKDKDTIFDNRYHLDRLLGGGAFSQVWLATDIKTGVEVALKIYTSTDFDSNGLEMFAREYGLVADVNHPNILRPLYFESEKKPYLVLQYCPKGSLKKMVGKINEQQAWEIIRDVANGLNALHSHRPAPIIHQDIKPENIMIHDDGHYMITDFGVSVHIKTTQRKTLSSSLKDAGTRAYMAPERFGSKRLFAFMASDIWSLGAMMFELLTGEVPFGEDGGYNQKTGIFDMPELIGDYSDRLKDTIIRCLALEMPDRPFVENLIEIANEMLNGNKTIPEPEPVPDLDSDSDWMKHLGYATIGGIAIGSLLAILL